MLPDAEYVLQLRADGLRELGIRRALEQAAVALAPQAVEPLAEVADTCSLGWDGFDELIVSGSLEDDDVLAVVVTRQPSEMLRCLMKLDGAAASPARLWGLDGAELDGDGCLYDPGRGDADDHA